MIARGRVQGSGTSDAVASTERNVNKSPRATKQPAVTTSLLTMDAATEKLQYARVAGYRIGEEIGGGGFSK